MPAKPGHSTPDLSLQRLLEGNQRFCSDQAQHPDQDPASRNKLHEAQWPFAAILSCSDSRVPPQLIFDQGLGDLFTNRIAGHVVDDMMIASLAYSVIQLEVPLIVVLGHTGCGAVRMAVDKVLNNKACDDAITSYICPAIKAAQTCSGELLDNAIRINVRQTVETLSEQPEFAARIDSNRLRIIGAVYELTTGEVVVNSTLKKQQSQ